MDTIQKRIIAIVSIVKTIVSIVVKNSNLTHDPTARRQDDQTEKGRATASRLAVGAWLRFLNTEDTEIDTEAMTRGCSRKDAKAQRYYYEAHQKTLEL